MKEDAMPETETCKIDPDSPIDHANDPLLEAEGDILIEVICERVHCVMYDYAITTVELTVEDFSEDIAIRPVVRRGNLENTQRYLELCRLNGTHLSVPTILFNGEVMFTSVPTPDELRDAIRRHIDGMKGAVPD